MPHPNTRVVPLNATIDKLKRWGRGFNTNIYIGSDKKILCPVGNFFKQRD